MHLVETNELIISYKLIHDAYHIALTE